MLNTDTYNLITLQTNGNLTKKHSGFHDASYYICQLTNQTCENFFYKILFFLSSKHFLKFYSSTECDIY
jgi:hypothetical protein